ncbi:hypothetical protein [Streptomyces sp. DW26H14]|uniref:hypothetical protein n=1 Tax=Streptomyces sp. DW26H14 TaxID=3435395 RepID=UPI00403E1A84
MRSGLLALRAAGVAGILVAVPVYGATAAQAHDGVTATVDPTAIATRGQARITVEGCRDGRATVSSSAFVRVVTVSGSSRTMYGDVSVKSLTAAGSYDISVNCDGHDHGRAGRFEVVGGAHGHDGHQGVASPHAPVRAGGGGTAALADHADSARSVAVSPTQSGPGTAYTLVGLGLAGVAAITVAYRSAQRRRAAAAPASRDAD